MATSEELGRRNSQFSLSLHISFTAKKTQREMSNYTPKNMEANLILTTAT